MATLTKNTVTREVVKTEEVEVFNLQLDKEELTFLKCLLYNTGGDPELSYRKYERQISPIICNVVDDDLYKKMVMKLDHPLDFKNGF